MNRVEELTRIMAKLSAGTDAAAIGASHGDFLVSVQPLDVALAANNLLASGMFICDFYNLCSRHLKTLGEPVNAFMRQLSSGHALRRIIENHRQSEQALMNLERTNLIIKAMPATNITTTQCQQFLNIFKELDWIDRHIALEHQFIFPELDKAGFGKLIRLVRFEHLDLQQSYTGLSRLAQECALLRSDEFKDRLDSITQCLVPMGRMHLMAEQVVVYPIAAHVITAPPAWEQFFPQNRPLKQSA